MAAPHGDPRDDARDRGSRTRCERVHRESLAWPLPEVCSQLAAGPILPDRQAMSTVALAPHTATSGLSRSLFTAEDVAQALAVSETLVRQLTLSGDIPCRRIGRLVRYAQADVDAFVSRCDERGY